MKCVMLVRQRGLRHILYGNSMLRVGWARRIRILCGVQKVLDLGSLRVVDFGHIRFEVRGRIVIELFPEEELVAADLLRRGRYRRVRKIESLCEGWRGRSMIPAQVTRWRRQSRRIVCDIARMGAVIISELE